MSEQADNVIQMDAFRKDEEPGRSKSGRKAGFRHEGMIAIWVSLAACCIVCLLFLVMWGGMRDLAAEVRGLGALRVEMAGLGERLDRVENQPTAGARKVLLGAMLDELVQKAEHASGLIEDEDSAARLAEVQEHLRLVRQRLQQ